MDPLLGNGRNTHLANNTGAVFSVVRAATIVMQRAIHAANDIEEVFSVLRGPCRDYIREAVWRIVEPRQENERVRGIEQGEARHIKYKRLKLGGNQAYDRSNE
jgi:hypothetical protein